MKVIKRDGTAEAVKFDKISNRIKKQTYGLNMDFVDYMEVSKKVINGLYDGVTTVDLDVLASETAASLSTVHPDYSLLAARITMTSLHKQTSKKFSETAKKLYNYINPKTGESAGMISDEIYSIIEKNATEFDNMIVNDRDFNFNFFGYKTLERAYLLKTDGKIAETPQHMYMRVSVGIWGDNLEMVEKTYELLSTGRLSHATPTLFNSGTKRPQNSSCFLLAMKDDSISGIYETLQDVAKISQSAGGIGLHIHNVRAKGSYIKGTNGVSNGIIPMLKVFNETARYVDQGGGKRKGSVAVYLEPWHSDIYDFIDLRKNRGKEEMRARDLFLALWTPDLFMQRVKDDADWTLMCPAECKGLSDVYDDVDNKAFTKLYEKYEREGKGRKTVKARELWAKVLEAQIETGTPYILYKDAANRKSNQKNIGVIKSSNLCIAEDQRVPSNYGYLTAKELCDLDKELVLTNGNINVDSSKMILRGEQEDVYKITLENGMEHTVTSYHGLPVLDKRNKITRVECKNLKIGDKIAIQTQKGIFGQLENINEAYLLGLYQSDGTQSESTIMFDIWENDFDLVPDIENRVQELYSKYNYIPRYSNKGGKFVDCNVVDLKVAKKRLTSQFFKTTLKFEKGYVPKWIWESNEETQWSYIKGLLQADGTAFLATSEGNPISISYSDINIDFLKDLQLLFNNLGLQTSIRLLHKKGIEMLPNGKGGKSPYKIKDCFRLCLGNKNDALLIEENTGFLSRKNIMLENRKYRDNTKKGYKILSIEYVGKKDVYCPTIKNDEHIFVSQGFKTFNCTEIMEVSTPTEIAVCNLASLPVNRFIDIPKSKDKSKRAYNFKELYDCTYQATINLNRVIDINYYPTKETKKSNMKHRPIGLGIQGLADTFALLGYAFDSVEAKKLNKEIFETMYHAAISASCDLAKKDGSYDTFKDSPMSKGIFQFDMWDSFTENDLSGRYDWDLLKKEVVENGVRNSLLLAPMPTASTAQILDNNECFEPFTSNIYKRNTLSGEYIMVNKYLVEDLIAIDMWNDKTRIDIIQNNGSIQALTYIPQKIRDMYKTVWEISQKVVMDMSADRGLFICQSQSMNLFIPNVNSAKLNSALFYGWEKGLKTGMYYMRTTVKSEAMKSLGINIGDVEEPTSEDALSGLSCSLDNPEDCEACGA